MEGEHTRKSGSSYIDIGNQADQNKFKNFQIKDLYNSVKSEWLWDWDCKFWNLKYKQKTDKFQVVLHNFNPVQAAYFD